MSGFPKTVLDEDGNRHDLIGDPLGRGGQGVVLRTRNAHIAVKLVTGPSGMPVSAGGEAGHTALRRRLEDVRLLPLTDMHLAQPLALLRDQVGYTMRLLGDMVPIRSLIAPPGSSLGAFYRDTGGLRRRLQLLARTAALLARLHAIPLVYADVSPNNVFVSEGHDANEVWLIDLDNLQYLSDSSAGIFTPGFGAPEVVTGRAGVTTLSDAYAFAVLAFQVLAQVHPFLGDFVEEAGWDSDEDREQLAYEGKIPWIEDADDPSNRSAHGIPRELVIPKPLLALFQRTFGPGRQRPDARPGLTEWTDLLRRLADRLLSCSACGSNFYVARDCPFCESGRGPFIQMEVHRWDPEFDDDGGSAVSTEPVWRKIIDLADNGALAGLVQRHVIAPVLAAADDEPVLRIRQVPGGIQVELLTDCEVHLLLRGRLQRLEGRKLLPVPIPGDESLLHFGPLDRPHRLARLRWHGNGA
ncbi:protein kinase domain-containing protein [Thiocapsa roseopersicina]|uniref:Protein kinase domain-containing protein n=1 Tax=Thiocapsa roseopersicina TaxID=1058 RepID=A0A1H2YAZ3_THIRO|nr:lipopolysaccharide kinase InaA family protein [Thiocapsa roseopersicina]SDX01729.1 Protein kinase domain-containing protein [Thiocapsa roseopersicina]